MGRTHAVEVVKDLVHPHDLVVELVIAGGGGQEGVAIRYKHVEEIDHLQEETEDLNDRERVGRREGRKPGRGGKRMGGERRGGGERVEERRREEKGGGRREEGEEKKGEGRREERAGRSSSLALRCQVCGASPAAPAGRCCVWPAERSRWTAGT